MNELPQASPTEPPASAPHDELLRQLLDLAYDVCSRLRHHALPIARLSAALLLAASVAACSGVPEESTPVPPVAQTVPLTQEVRTGLPTQPGRYPLAPGSVARDARGVYQFGWTGEGGAQTQASASRMQLAQGDQDELVVPEQGDPVLSLGPNTPIRLTESTTATSGGVGGFGFVPALWYPLRGPGFGRDPYYYDPPRTVPSGSTIDGGTRTTTPKPLGERTIGLDRAVSGRAGGTGSGTAATTKSGASFGGRTAAAAAAAPKSAPFSAGRAAPSIGLSGG